MKPAEAYILRQNEPYKSILLQLQSIIEAVLPQPELFFKWKIPFYYNKELPICYLNQSKDYVDLAFWHGDKLSQHRTSFVTEKRKSVTSLRYKTIADIDDVIIKYVLEAQLQIDVNPFKLTRVGQAKN